MGLKSRSYDSVSPYNPNYHNADSKETKLIITQADIDCENIQRNSRKFTNLEKILFVKCSEVGHNDICDLFRWNRNIKEIRFQNCCNFKADAFEAFRALEKSLEIMDLSGYYITREEVKSLIRASFEVLRRITFQNRTDIHDKFVETYPSCEIIILQDSYEDKNRMKHSKSEFDVIGKNKYCHGFSDKDRDKLPEHLVKSVSQLNINRKQSDSSSKHSSRGSSKHSIASIKQKLRKERNFIYRPSKKDELFKDDYDDDDDYDYDDDDSDSDDVHEDKIKELIKSDFRRHNISPIKKKSPSLEWLSSSGKSLPTRHRSDS